MINDARAKSAIPAVEERRAPNRSAAAAEQDEDGSGQQVGVDHPLDCRGIKLQVASHGRQRRHDSRAVVAD
jgi:hypothetical protein